MPANLENSAVATGLEKSVFIPIPKKGNAKECSNYRTIALISHVSKVMTNLDNILKSRDITLLTKVSIVKSLVFPVVMYRCESWTIKKTEQQELMLSNCGAGEDSWESLGLQGDQTSQS